MQDEWVTIQEAAAHYAVSPKTIRNWIVRGTVEAKRIGPRLIRVNVRSLENIATDIAAGGAA